MEWINLNVSVLQSADFILASDSQRSAWLNVYLYCAVQENGGRITNCKAWDDRTWLQLVRVTRRAVLSACKLWRWEGDDLVVEFYNQVVEANVRRLRSQAASAGRARWGPAQPNGMPSGIPQGMPSGTRNGIGDGMPNGTGSGTGYGNAKGKERKGKEKEGKESTPYPQGGTEPVGFIPTPRQLVLNRIFNRRDTTRWSQEETKAMTAAGLDQISDEQFAADAAAVIEFYQAEIPEATQRKFWRRTELVRVLRHWPGEIDRARGWRDWQDKKNAERGEGRL